MKSICAALVLALAFALPARAASAPALGAAERAAVITALAQALEDDYVFPDRATAAANALFAAQKSGTYDADTDPEAFAGALTKTLAGVLHDKHVHVEYSSEVLPKDGGDAASKRESYQRDRAGWAEQNFGLFKAVRLRANVGYLDVRAFPNAPMMGDQMAAAMQFLSNTDALIIDLRKNTGGDPASVALLCSFLFPPWERVHVNDIYRRTPKTQGGQTRQYWTTYVPTNYLDKKVYVLTSAFTFSGGEEFAYDMQTQKRATLVGEVTGGGANPGEVERLSDHFAAFIPFGRAVNPITHTNWEGVGVKPDVATTAAAALATAYVDVLRQKLAAATDPDDRKALSDLIDLFTKSPETILTQ